MRIRWGATALVAVLLTACSTPSPAPVDLAEDLAGRIGIDALYAHLEALQDIADRTDGNRAQDTPGFDESVDYVANALRDNGFEVQTPEFERYGGTRGGATRLTVNGRGHPVEKASLLVDTGPKGIDAVTLRPTTPAGCTARDYGNVDVRGAIAVVDDKGCSVVAKQNTAKAKGAVGLLVVSGSAGQGSPPSLFSSGYYRELTMPVGIISPEVSAALRRTTAPVTLRLDGQPVMVKSRNVLAQTRTGDTRNVVMAGAHLDSVGGGPGINDNGTGVAAVLETALQLGHSPQVANAVRFAFWGSEEIGLEGSRAYLRDLGPGQLDDIALYLNFDMLGSPNAGYFTYDGDQSAATTPTPVPEGSAGVERVLSGYLNETGVRPADMPLGDHTDYYPFLAAGVPIGGATTGAAQLKTEVQARLWGGRAGTAFDPNYHTRRDTIDNVDRKALELMAPAVGFAVGTYAQSTDGVNGVPPRDARHRR
ncbi:M28 family peptidase [Mycobacterium sp. GA-2829]|uniref:M28 family peptidase n=1 Tax=Mycobacterium sp. GA-2829 TaxID=1772283 RepID=UPI00073FC7F7|nr:M28 family peptidase [Mycobacterium sp. GA-2829]KUI23723.1 peptidase M28 [Mycobacterium sp. GA-2829]